MKVPRKNISRIVADIKARMKPGLSTSREVPSPLRIRPRIFVFIGIFLCVVVGVILILTQTAFITPRGNIADRPQVGGSIPGLWHQFTDRFLPFLKDGLGTYQKAADSSRDIFRLVNITSTLQTDFFAAIQGKEGEAFVHTLTDLRETLHSLRGRLGDLGGSKVLVTLGLSADNGLSLGLEFERAEHFLNVLIPWLTSTSSRHIAIFFYNPSELRPGGGFLGVFADVVVDKGAVSAIHVHDINEVDRTRNIYSIPPKPLQLIEKNWHTANANWFFDFADSAKKTISFMESSELYRASSTTFDAAIAVDPRVMSDVLSLTGPITISDFGITLTADNLMEEIQKFVVESESSGKKLPKDILVKAAPVLLQKLELLTLQEKAGLWGFAKNWIEKKDVMFYSSVPAFQSFAESYDAAGHIYALPADFVGDYLAMFATTLASGKTEFVMKNEVTLESQMNLDGTVDNHLTIARTNQGDKSTSWWYRMPNQVMLEVAVPVGTRIITATGGKNKSIASPLAYTKLGYTVDADIAKIESTMSTTLDMPGLTAYRESGKQVFRTWITTDRGGAHTFSLDYQERLFKTPYEGMTYQFVLEKQAQSTGRYHITINSPVGYVFAENNLPVYEYKSDAIPARTIISLTLKKIE